MSHESVSITWVIGLVLAEKQVPTELQRVDLHKNNIRSCFWEIFSYFFSPEVHYLHINVHAAQLPCAVVWRWQWGSISQHREGRCLQCLSWAHHQRPGPDLWSTSPRLKLVTSELKLGHLVTWKVSTLTFTLDFTKHAFVVSLFKIKTEHSPTEQHRKV